MSEPTVTDGFDPDDPTLDEGALEQIGADLEDDPNEVDPYVDGGGSATEGEQT